MLVVHDAVAVEASAASISQVQQQQDQLRQSTSKNKKRRPTFVSDRLLEENETQEYLGPNVFLVEEFSAFLGGVFLSVKHAWRNYLPVLNIYYYI